MATGKYGSASAWFLCDGYNLIANKLKGLRHTHTALTERTDGLGDSWEEHTPTGLSKVELTQEGALWDTDTVRIHAAMASSVPTSPQATPRVLCLGFAGHTVGEMFLGLQGAFTATYEVLATLGALTKANATHLISGQLDKGTIIQPLATKTADWNTKTLGTTVDYTLDTSQRVRAISNISVANPTVITAAAHGLATGDIILIAGSDSTPTVNGERTVTVLTASTFTVPVNVTVQGTTGTFVCANSANGGVGYQQITAGSGFTNFVGKLRDSPDDVTYADLITFADTVADPIAERATVTGTVDRYLSYDGNVTGTGTITVFAGFSRS